MGNGVRAVGTTDWGNLTEQDWQKWIVERGGTVESVLERAGLPVTQETLAAVAKRNQIEDFQSVTAGMQLELPSTWTTNATEWQAVIGTWDASDYAPVWTDRRAADRIRAAHRQSLQIEAPGGQPGEMRVVMNERGILVVRALDDELRKSNPSASRVNDLLRELYANHPRQEVTRLMEALGTPLEPTLREKFDGRELAHVLAYVRSGTLEWPEYLYFAANGWNDRLIGGLATGEATMKWAIYQIRPDDPDNNYEMAKQRLWTLYPTDNTSFGASGRIREDAPMDGSLLPAPANQDPIYEYITREFSGKDERWLLAVPHLPRTRGNRVAAAYKAAFEISESDGNELLRQLEHADRETAMAISEAFSWMAQAGLLPKARGSTLDAHARTVLSATTEWQAFQSLMVGIRDENPASLQAAAAYAENRLWATFGFNDDEDEMVRLLSTLVGDGTTRPTWRQIEDLRPGLGDKILSNLDGDQYTLAKLIIDGVDPDSPELTARRLMAIDDEDLLRKVLSEQTGAEMVAIRAAAVTAFGAGALRAHLASIEGEWLEANQVHDKRIPERIVALYDRGDATQMARYPEQLYVQTATGWEISAAAKILYGSMELDGWIFGKTDEDAIFEAAKKATNAERATVHEDYQALANLTSNKASLTSRLNSELSAQEAANVLRDLQPTSFSADADDARAQARAAAAQVVAEIKKGMPGVLGTFDMERGMVKEALGVFETDVQWVYDQVAQRVARGESPNLTPAEQALLQHSVEQLMGRLEFFIEERGAVADGIRQGTIMAGALVAAGVVFVASGGTGAPLSAYILAMGIGGAGGAVLGDATDGLDATSTEFWLRDLVGGGLEGAAWAFFTPAGQIKVIYPALRALPWLGKTQAITALGTETAVTGWTYIAQQMASQGMTFGAMGGVTGFSHAITDEDLYEMAFFEATADVFFESAKGFGMGAAFGAGFAFATAGPATAWRAVLGRGGTATADALPVVVSARDRVARNFRVFRDYFQGTYQGDLNAMLKELGGSLAAARAGRQAISAEAKQAMEREAITILESLAKAPAGAEPQVAAQTQMILTGLWEAGIDVPSQQTQRLLIQVFKNLGVGENAAPRSLSQLEAWLSAQGFTEGPLTERLLLASSRQTVQVVERAKAGAATSARQVRGQLAATEPPLLPTPMSAEIQREVQALEQWIVRAANESSSPATEWVHILRKLSHLESRAGYAIEVQNVEALRILETAARRQVGTPAVLDTEAILIRDEMLRGVLSGLEGTGAVTQTSAGIWRQELQAAILQNQRALEVMIRAYTNGLSNGASDQLVRSAQAKVRAMLERVGESHPIRESAERFLSAAQEHLAARSAALARGAAAEDGLLRGLDYQIRVAGGMDAFQNRALAEYEALLRQIADVRATIGKEGVSIAGLNVTEGEVFAAFESRVAQALGDAPHLTGPLLAERAEILARLHTLMSRQPSVSRALNTAHISGALERTGAAMDARVTALSEQVASGSKAEVEAAMAELRAISEAVGSRHPLGQGNPTIQERVREAVQVGERTLSQQAAVVAEEAAARAVPESVRVLDNQIKVLHDANRSGNSLLISFAELRANYVSNRALSGELQLQNRALLERLEATVESEIARSVEGTTALLQRDTALRALQEVGFGEGAAAALARNTEQLTQKVASLRAGITEGASELELNRILTELRRIGDRLPQNHPLASTVRRDTIEAMTAAREAIATLERAGQQAARQAERVAQIDASITRIHVEEQLGRVAGEADSALLEAYAGLRVQIGEAAEALGVSQVQFTERAAFEALEAKVLAALGRSGNGEFIDLAYRASLLTRLSETAGLPGVSTTITGRQLSTAMRTTEDAFVARLRGIEAGLENMEKAQLEAAAAEIRRGIEAVSVEGHPLAGVRAQAERTLERTTAALEGRVSQAANTARQGRHRGAPPPDGELKRINEQIRDAMNRANGTELHSPYIELQQARNRLTTKLDNLRNGGGNVEAATREGEAMLRRLEQQIEGLESQIVSNLEGAAQRLEASLAGGTPDQGALIGIAAQLDAANHIATSIGRLPPRIRAAVDKANESMRTLVTEYERLAADAIQRGFDPQQAVDLAAIEGLITGNPLFSRATRTQLEGALNRLKQQFEGSTLFGGRAPPTAEQVFETAAQAEAAAKKLVQDLPGRIQQVRSLVRTDAQAAARAYRDIIADAAAIQRSIEPRGFMAIINREGGNRTLDTQMHRVWQLLTSRQTRRLEGRLKDALKTMGREDVEALMAAVEYAPRGIGDGFLRALNNAAERHGLAPLQRWSRFRRRATWVGAGALVTAPIWGPYALGAIGIGGLFWFLSGDDSTEGMTDLGNGSFRGLNGQLYIDPNSARGQAMIEHIERTTNMNFGGAISGNGMVELPPHVTESMVEEAYASQEEVDDFVQREGAAALAEENR